VIRALALTALNNAFRAVYNDGLPVLSYRRQEEILLARMVVEHRGAAAVPVTLS
jgi:hypothetical protein